MGISFGSASKKPYVGSKEVQEAYVGSQLVYKAVPPYLYRFLGSENDYILDGELGYNTEIVKVNGIYRISLQKTGASFIFKTDKTFNTLTFTAYGAKNYSSQGQWIQYGTATGTGSYRWSGQTYFTTGTTDFTLVTVPSQWKNFDAIKIETTGSTGKSGYIDSVKFE